MADELTHELLEEYRICRDSSHRLESNVYRTATIFGIGSAAAIAVVTQGFGVLATAQEISPIDRLLTVTLATALALAGWFTWWRMAERWRSVSWAMIVRMQHIERSTGLRANLYVRALDDYREMQEGDQSEFERRVQFVHNRMSANFNKPYLDQDQEENLRSFTGQHEYRGIKPMIRFLVWVNVFAWLLLLVWQVLRAIVDAVGSGDPLLWTYTLVALAVIAVVSLAFAVCLRTQWVKP